MSYDTLQVDDEDTGLYGASLFYIPATPSVMDNARTIIHTTPDAVQHGTVVITDYQTSGRGQYGRVWVSPKNTALAIAVVAHPDRVPCIAMISLIAGLAVQQSVAELLSCDSSEVSPVEIKWPNDVLIDGRKTSGVLSETYKSLYITGIGINITAAPAPEKHQSTSMRVVPTCLLDHGYNGSVRQVYRVLQKHLERALMIQSCARVRKEVENHLWMRGKRVTVQIPGVASGTPLSAVQSRQQTTAGVLTGVENDGALVLDNTRAIYTGCIEIS